LGIEGEVGLELEVVELFLGFAANQEARRAEAVREAILADARY
jgi:hypothetical protein